MRLAFTLCVVLALGLQALAFAGTNQLVSSLLMNYNTHEGVPTQEQGQKLAVTQSIELRNAEICTEKDTLTLLTYRTLTWTDYRLQWNPESYANISMVHIPASRLWIPDITLYTTAETKERARAEIDCIVYSSGMVVYVPMTEFHALCNNTAAEEASSGEERMGRKEKRRNRGDRYDDEFDYKKDSASAYLNRQLGKFVGAFSKKREQATIFRCELKMGSWTYSGNDIDIQITSNTTETGYYHKNHRWELIENRAERRVSRYPNDPDTEYPNIRYNFAFKKRAGFGSGIKTAWKWEGEW